MKTTSKTLSIIAILAFFINGMVSGLGAVYAVLFEAPQDIVLMLLGVTVISFIIVRLNLKWLD